MTDHDIRRLARQPEEEDFIRDIAAMQRTINRLHGATLVPRGVYRFSSHEEADAWMTRQIASAHPRQSLKPS